MSRPVLVCMRVEDLASPVNEVAECWGCAKAIWTAQATPLGDLAQLCTACFAKEMENRRVPIQDERASEEQIEALARHWRRH